MADQDDEVPWSCGCGKCKVKITLGYSDFETSSLNLAAGLYILIKNWDSIKYKKNEAKFLYAQECKPELEDKVKALYSFYRCPRILKYAEKFDDWKEAVAQVRREVADELDLPKNITIEVRTLSRKSVQIQINSKENVRNLKRKIETKEGVPEKNQKLVFNGKVMEDKNTADFYKIVEGSSIQLFKVDPSKK